MHIHQQEEEDADPLQERTVQIVFQKGDRAVELNCKILEDNDGWEENCSAMVWSATSLSAPTTTVPSPRPTNQCVLKCKTEIWAWSV